MTEPNEREREVARLAHLLFAGFERSDEERLATMLAAYRAGVLEAPLKRIAELEAENARWVGIIKRREAQLAAIAREAMGHGKGGG